MWAVEWERSWGAWESSAWLSPGMEQGRAGTELPAFAQPAVGPAPTAVPGALSSRRSAREAVQYFTERCVLAMLAAVTGAHSWLIKMDLMEEP